MYHLARCLSLSSRVAPIVCATATLAIPATNAYAAPLDDAVQTVTSSPLATFGVGCAVGAVVGGLVVGISSGRTKRRLKREVSDVVQAAERAEEATRRAEALLEKQKQIARLASQKTGVIEREPSKKKETSSAESTPDLSTTGSLLRDPVVVAREEMSGGHPSTSVRPRRRRRNEISKNLPVIDRGRSREAEGPTPIVPRHSQRPRAFDPVARASIIDRRIPRFDESLFPDTTSDLQQQADMFEIAMRAMDETMPEQTQGEVGFEESPMTVVVQPQSKPEISDAESYVEYLMHDEMERSRAKSAGSYSHGHLTMFEGTGDLGAAKKALAYSPRHMQPTTKEA